MERDYENGGRNGGSRLSIEQFAALRSTFLTLRQDGLSLARRLRGSIREMRQLRTRLNHGRAAADSGRRPVPSRLELQFGLTTREVEVAHMLAEGCSNAGIAERLSISPHTVRHHTQRVLAKLGVHSRAAAGARVRGM